MRRGLAIATFCGALVLAGAVLAAPAGAPLAALMASRTSPSRMYAARGDVELPAYFARGGETGVTVLAWVRYAAPSDWGALMLWASHSEVPARATLEGGDELPAFLDLASVPLSSSATWGASGVVPQDVPGIPGVDDGGKFVVCVNCDADRDLTLLVGGSELEIPATNGYVRNVEVLPGDASVSVAAASPSASVRLALAVNPWVRFVAGPSLVYYVDGSVISATAITNCWTLVAWRAEIAGGEMRETLEIIDRAGVRMASSSSSSSDAPALVRDARCRLYGGSLISPVLPGGGRRALDLYGVKFAGRRLTDEEVWRVWELDLAEIRRRGLDTAIWAPGEGPQ